jgi:hypothetical protein
MKFAPFVMLLLAVCCAGTARAQAPGGGDPEQRRRLVEQKIKLVETLINSPAAKSAAYGREAESTQFVERSTRAVAEARKAVDDGRFDDAAKHVDEALKAASAASRKLAAAGPGLSESAQRKSLDDLAEQLATYRASVVEMTRDAKVGAAAKTLLTKVDGLAAEAKQMSDSGRLGDANKKLADAYKIVVQEISWLRAGQEVVLSLKFDTPADEYAYEQKRYSSNEIMVDMMVGEGRADGDKRRMVEGFVGEGRRLKGQAETQAQAGQYKDAVTSMEKATVQLNRALQSMGVPVF